MRTEGHDFHLANLGRGGRGRLERTRQGEVLCCGEQRGCENVLEEETGKTGWGRIGKGERFIQEAVGNAYKHLLGIF